MSIVQREHRVLMIKSSEVTPRGRRSFGMICGALALLIAGVVLVSCDGSYPPPSNVAVGESCWLNSQCAGDLVCAGTIGSSVCSNRSIGSACTSAGHCDSGLVCAGTIGNSVCSNRSAGSACASASHCASGLVCDTTTSDGDAASDLCEAPVSVVATALGGSCLLTSQCASGLVCAGTIGNSVCSNRSVGSACASASHCDSGLVCAGTTGNSVCSNRSVDSACSSASHCNSGLYCDTTIKDGDAASDTCKAQQVAGGICSSAEQCASGLQCTADIVGNTRCSSGSIALGGAVRIGSAVNFGVVMPAVETDPSGLAVIGDTLYMVGDTNNALYSLNSSSGVATRIGMATNFGVGEESPQGLAVIGSTLYMVGRTTDILYTVHTTTGVATRAAPSVTRFGITESGISAFLSSGLAAVGNTLYLAAVVIAGDQLGRLYRFDTDGSGNFDGTATRVGTSNNFGVAEKTPGGITGIGTTLYMVGSIFDVLYTVNTTSGVATRVGRATAFGVSGEGIPNALATIGSTLYMLGLETDALYALRYQ